MGFFDAFTGAAQRRRAEEGYQRSTAALNDGWNEGRGYAERGQEAAMGYLRPYRQSGEQANQLYGRFLGLNGADDQRAAMGQYATSDPFRDYNQDQATRGMARRFNAMGYQPNGGTASYAMSRALLDRGSQDYENYLNRLGQAGQQGYGAASTSAGLSSQYGQNMLASRMGLANTMAGNEIQRANALSQADSILPNNLLRIGGMVMGGFTPGPGGNTPFGNMGRALNFLG